MNTDHSRPFTTNREEPLDVDALALRITRQRPAAQLLEAALDRALCACAVDDEFGAGLEREQVHRVLHVLHIRARRKV